ncbi:hypothetical protein [Glutamicibacter ardleyensis]|uniref:WXG100 family type VII secretion target n=1 Tax=Glutamicibacter ardleyensis TaxID=225894 RepID=A0ABQ2E014_9MICC|nr:hypothetical protein [Glutamicibacter ardleyensis]GGJ74559.1 hypothetical protein GCM10007173_36930 [Glutamicibacter ardleyensis]
MGDVSRRYFRANTGSKVTPAAVAEASALEARVAAYEQAKTKAYHLLSSLKVWQGFDATGNISGAIEHTLTNIDDLHDDLDALYAQIVKFRGKGDRI